MEKTHKKLQDYLPEFVEEFEEQLDNDEIKWGDTWRTRTIEGQEMRTKARFDDYFDQFKYANTPIPWLKIIGNAYICWVRELEQEKHAN